jgi:6-pyruvoyltetrahydropterin 2'-reductase
MSIQGEGRFMGAPSIFLRMFGCNFRCKKFNVDKNSNTEVNAEVSEIIKNINLYKKLEDLPLVKTGCDSYMSIYPEFKRFVKKESINDIVNGIIQLLPFGEWREEHLVITGGEPLLGWQRSYPELLSHEKMEALKYLTFETNGTQPISSMFEMFLSEWINERCYSEGLTFSVSPKLPASGEKWEDAIKPQVVMQYASLGYTYLKFVVATEEDVKDAEKAVEEYRKHGFKGPVYLMPVGGVESVYSLNNKKVALMALERGWCYSDRLQVPLFKNEWGT